MNNCRGLFHDQPLPLNRLHGLGDAQNPQRRRPRAEGPTCNTLVRPGHLGQRQVNHMHQAVLHGVPHPLDCAPHDRDLEHLLAFQRGNVKPLPAFWVLPATGPGPGWQRLHVLRLTAQTVNDSRAIHHKMPDRPWLWLQVESSVLHLVLHEGHWLIWLKLGASRHVSNVASISLQLWLGPLIWPSSMHSLRW